MYIRTEASKTKYTKEKKKPRKIAEKMMITVNRFIVFVGLGKGIGTIIKLAEIKTLRYNTIIESVIKLIDKRNIVAADAGRPRNTCLFFSG